MPDDNKQWKVEFYTTAHGRCPVLEYVEGLPEEDQVKAYNDLRLLREFGVQLGMPNARPLTGHKPLWELRPYPNRLIYFAHTGRRFVILHAFKKTKKKTPRKEIKIAERRMEDFLERIGS